MALWGNKDKKAVTGTIAVTEDSVDVVGTSTLFTTELKVGNVLNISDVEYQIASIQSNTALKLKQAYADSTASGLTVDAYEKPAYLAQSELGDVYGISASEVSTTEAKNVGINTAGWGKYTTYVDGNGNTRHKFESLVAMGTISGDGPDGDVLPEPGTITIDTQPVNDSVTTSDTGEFVVVASIDTNSSLTYQWQEFDGDDWVELTGETSATFTTDATTIADDGREFRVIVMAAGADSVISDTVTLTVENAVITIDNQPVNDSVTTGDAGEFVVVASVTGDATLAYQWEVSTDSGTTWTELHTTTDTLTVGSTDPEYVDGNQFRVVVSADKGADPVTSDAATLTVI